MTKIIGCVSGKGGVGKSTSAINLGSALNSYGKNTAIVDANLTTPNVGIYLGVPVVPVTLHHVLQGKKNINEATYLHPSGTKIIPGDLSIGQLKKTDPEKLEKALLDLEGTLDYVILDGAAGLGRETLATVKAADELLVVTNPEMPALTDALKTIQLAHKMKKPILGILLTRNREDGMDIPIKEVEKMLEYPVIGVIPEDSTIRQSLFVKNPVIFSHPKSAAAKSYQKLAAKIAGEKYKEEKENKNLFDKLREFFG